MNTAESAASTASRSKTPGRPDGAYSLQYKAGIDGAKVGEHEVVISTFVEASGDEGEEKTPGRKEEILKKYTQTPSEMKLLVQAGDNIIDLDLTSD